MIIDGRHIAEEIESELREKVPEISSLKDSHPRLGIICSEESRDYSKMISKLCEKIGVQAIVHSFPSTASEEEVVHLVKVLNSDHEMDGILLHRPMQIPDDKIIRSINSVKDVYGYHNYKKNCEAQAVIKILDTIQAPVEGRHVVVIGRGEYVSIPIARTLIENGATVTVCHSKTFDLSWHTSQADIVVSGVGMPGLINADMVKPDAVVIDAGMSKIGDAWKGDAEDSVKDKVAYITPVPGGVGPVVSAMILKNLIKNFATREIGKTRIMI